MLSLDLAERSIYPLTMNISRHRDHPEPLRSKLLRLYILIICGKYVCYNLDIYNPPVTSPDTIEYNVVTDMYHIESVR